jgi:hypothetical protein
MAVKSKVAAPSTKITAPSTVSTITTPILGTGIIATTTGASAMLPLGNKNATGFRLKLQQMVAGLQAVLANNSAIPTTGAAALTKADMLTKLTVGLTDYATIDSLENADILARKQLATDLPGLKAYYAQVREALQVFFGKTNPQLGQFGLVVAKPRAKQTPEELLVANTRRTQTRGMRNTLGAKQKAAIQFQGQVAVTATPSSTSAAAAAASPAAALAQSAQPAAVAAPAQPAVDPVLQIVKP